MSPVELFPWIFAVTIAVIHLFGDRLSDDMDGKHEAITSFAVGVTITYVFLQLLPEHHRGITHLGEAGSLTVLVGFSLIYLAEKYAYQHEKTAEALRRDFKDIHATFLFLYYFAIGTLLTYLAHQDLVHATLFFIPISFHTAISSLSLIELHEEHLNNVWVRIAITVAALLGTAFATFVTLNATAFHIVLGVVTGMFLYVAIRDAMPSRDYGRPALYILGTVFYTLVMLYVWQFV